VGGIVGGVGGGSSSSGGGVTLAAGGRNFETGAGVSGGRESAGGARKRERTGGMLAGMSKNRENGLGGVATFPVMKRLHSGCRKGEPPRLSFGFATRTEQDRLPHFRVAAVSFQHLEEEALLAHSGVPHASFCTIRHSHVPNSLAYHC